MREIPLNIVRGFLMGAADLVPGVSGGTIALVVGIYERLVSSIKAGSSALGNLLRIQTAAARDWIGRVEWPLLISLLIGIGVAVFSLASLIETQLHDRPIQLAALFLGLVGGSVVVAWRMLRKRDGVRLSILILVAAAVFLVLGLGSGTSEVSVDQTLQPAGWAFFAAGAVAICAMILPGISGSLILVLLGMYGPVLAAVNGRDFGSLGIFLLGAIVGLGLFSQFLNWALSTHHDTVVAALIGLMLGSMRVLWPWPDGVNSTNLGSPTEQVGISIALAVAAFLGVLGLSRLAGTRKKAATSNPV